MSDAAKPWTSFLIEDILAFKGSSRSTISVKCSSQKMGRCPPWEEEPETMKEQLYPQETAFSEQSGELECDFELQKTLKM